MTQESSQSRLDSLRQAAKGISVAGSQPQQDTASPAVPTMPATQLNYHLQQMRLREQQLNEEAKLVEDHQEPFRQLMRRAGRL